MHWYRNNAQPKKDHQHATHPTGKLPTPPGTALPVRTPPPNKIDNKIKTNYA
jgi:hypothetical protein